MAMRPVKQLPIAKNVGLTLARVSNPLALYFVHKLSVDTWSLKQVAMDGSIKIITDTLPEADLFYVNTSGIYLEQEGVIYQLRNNQWKEMSKQFQGKEVIAFQISDAGNKIAILVSGN